MAEGAGLGGESKRPEVRAEGPARLHEGALTAKKCSTLRSLVAGIFRTCEIVINAQ